MSKRVIRFGSRDSALAVAQTRLVMDAVAAANPEYELELITMKTTGDVILDKALDQIGGKGLFVKELDRALRENRVDVTVHSLKDVPMQTPEDIPLLAFYERGDARDAMLFPSGDAAPNAALPIGCGSARRLLQLKALYPELSTKLIRGNVMTRLAKLDTGEYGALVLACAGLTRLGLTERIGRVFTVREMIPAAGQGVLVLQGRAEGDYAFLRCADHLPTRRAALAERAFVRLLDGGCSSPIAAHAQLQGEELSLTGLYYSESTGRHVFGTLAGDGADCEALGQRLAEKLKREADE